MASSNMRCSPSGNTRRSACTGRNCSQARKKGPSRFEEDLALSICRNRKTAVSQGRQLPHLVSHVEDAMLAGPAFSGEFPAVLGGHHPLHVLGQRAHRSDSAAEQFGHVGDLDVVQPAVIVVVGRGVGVLESAPLADVVDQNDTVSWLVGHIPQKLTLLDDHRFGQPVHHLRRIYIDPVTDRTDWDLVREGDGIVGVRSQSGRSTLKKRGFPREYEHFEELRTY
jgi:hypothetical protein